MKEWAVDWVEYEAGWGQRDDGTTYYDTKEEAAKAIRDYDAKYNNKSTVPSYYCKGHGPRQTTVKEMREYEAKNKPVVQYDI